MGKTIKAPVIVEIETLVSFDSFRRGERYVVERDALVEGWLTLGLVDLLHTTDPVEEVETDGESAVGPGSAEPDVLGDVEE